MLHHTNATGAPPPSMSLLASAKSVGDTATSLMNPVPGAQAVEASGMPRKTAASQRLLLCSELVVPSSSECTLVVPMLVDDYRPMEPVTISNLLDQTVFTAAFTEEGGHCGVHVCSLSSYGNSPTLFASCRIFTPETRAADMQIDPPLGTIHRQLSDIVFAELRATDGGRGRCFCIKSVKGEMYFRASEDLLRIHVTDECGQMLATVRPEQTGRRSVTIRPLVDAGLVVLTLVSIDCLRRQVFSLPSWTDLTLR